jgi:hypothetical protein
MRPPSAIPFSWSGWGKDAFWWNFHQRVVKMGRKCKRGILLGCRFRRFNRTGDRRLLCFREIVKMERRRPHVKFTFFYASQISKAAIVEQRLSFFPLFHFIMHNSYHTIFQMFISSLSVVKAMSMSIANCVVLVRYHHRHFSAAVEW